MGDGRNSTDWQQGFVLDGNDSVALGLIAAGEVADKVAIVATHDCDLLESLVVEPVCEILIGRRIDKVDGNFSNAKNPRRLHLQFSGGATSLVLELNATDKRTIEKDKLLARRPNAGIRLRPKELWTLRAWFATRYFRPSYPNEFDRRLKSDVAKRMAETIKKTSENLVAVLFDIDGGEPDSEKSEDDVYALNVFLVYDVTKDPRAAENAANTAAQSIRSIFRNNFFKDGKWRGIELKTCTAVSEEAMTIYNMRMTRTWHFDSLEILFGKSPT